MSPGAGTAEFVTFALSASHLVFPRICKEADFNIVRQNAATAAVLAIGSNEALQDAGYTALKARLIGDGYVPWKPRNELR